MLTTAKNELKKIKLKKHDGKQKIKKNKQTNKKAGKKRKKESKKKYIPNQIW